MPDEYRFLVVWNPDLIPAPQFAVQINGFHAPVPPPTTNLHMQRFIMKTAATELFQQHKFERLPALGPVEPSRVFALQLAEGQMDVLRRMVPKCEGPSIDHYALDESLDLRYQDEVEWDRAYQEAAAVYRAFSKEFSGSMMRDENVAKGQLTLLANDTLLIR